MINKCPKCHHDNPDTARSCEECGTQLDMIDKIPVVHTETLETPKEELTTGSTFAGRYQIIEELGKGGMGKVYKVQDTKIEEKIALKLIKPEIARDKKTIERFRNELKLARKIRHKNICQMFDLGEERGTHYITMEFVDGQDLKKLIRQTGQLAMGTTISIAKQVCDGLAEAHSSGVVHRDLKPSNIMIDADGNVRIMDFGIARSVEGKGITGAGMMIGTPEYMSPEQVEGKKVDQRSDVYSLGGILYEMVTGRVPFEGDTPFTIGIKHKSEAPQNPTELNPQIPDELNHMILKCLEKDKGKRYQDVSEIRTELENISKGIPTAETIAREKRPKTSKEITITFGWKKILIPTLVLIVIVAAGLILWSPWNKKAPVTLISDNPSVVILPFDDRSPLRDQETFCIGMMDEIIQKLSNIQGLKVISRTPAMKYKEDNLDPSEIGEKLDVQLVLDGSVFKDGNDIRVIVSLINVNDMSTIWSDTYDKNIEGVFEIQSEISQEITKALKAQLSPGEIQQLNERPTDNLDAYDHYIKGRSLFYTYDRSNNEQAIVHFKEALNLDPSFSLAHSGLSMCYTNYWNISLDADEKWLVLAEEAAKKAIELDDQSAEAHFAMGFVHETRKEYPDMEREMRKVLMLNPNHAHAHDSLGDVLHRYHGNLEEALLELNTALTLDPYLWGSYWNISEIYAKQGRYREAEQILLQAKEKDKNKDWTLSCLGRIYRFIGEYETGLEMFKMAQMINPARIRLHVDLGLIYLLQNNMDAAEAEAKSLIELPSNDRRKNFHYLFLKGWISLEQDEYESAIQNFKQALQSANSMSESSQRIIFWELKDIPKGIAEAYFQQGKYQEAMMEFNGMDDEPLGVFLFKPYMWALKHYKLGQIHERLNDLETAKQEYTIFLELWKDADPDIPEIVDAGNKLRELRR
jgi:serine/threonine protein kinase/cytochrome c-type biogenesis protein CcmH/NrfG